MHSSERFRDWMSSRIPARQCCRNKSLRFGLSFNTLAAQEVSPWFRMAHIPLEASNGSNASTRLFQFDCRSHRRPATCRQNFFAI